MAKDYKSSSLDTTDLYRIKDLYHPLLGGFLSETHPQIKEKEWMLYINEVQEIRLLKFRDSVLNGDMQDTSCFQI